MESFACQSNAVQLIITFSLFLRRPRLRLSWLLSTIDRRRGLLSTFLVLFAELLPFVRLGERAHRLRCTLIFLDLTVPLFIDYLVVGSKEGLWVGKESKEDLFTSELVICGL